MANWMDHQKLEKEQFAMNYGYITFEEMRLKSTLIFSQFDENWFISHVEKGFLTWVDRFCDQPLGCFQTFKEAEEFMDTLVRSLSVQVLCVYP